MHIANNLLSEILTYMAPNMSDIVYNTVNWIFTGLIFVIGCIILFYKRKDIRGFLEKNETEKRTYVYAFSSLWVIVFLIVHILFAISGIQKI